MLTKLNRLLGIARALGLWVHFHFPPIAGGEIQVSFSRDAHGEGNGVCFATTLDAVLDDALAFAIAGANKAVGRADTKIGSIEAEKLILVALLGDDIGVTHTPGVK